MVVRYAYPCAHAERFAGPAVGVLQYKAPLFDTGAAASHDVIHV